MTEYYGVTVDICKHHAMKDYSLRTVLLYVSSIQVGLPKKAF